MHALIESFKPQLRALAERHGVGTLLVFGSMARGDATPDSDVDFLLDNTTRLSGFQLGALQMDLQDLLGRKVDLVTLNALHPLLRERVLQEAVPLEQSPLCSKRPHPFEQAPLRQQALQALKQ